MKQAVLFQPDVICYRELMQWAGMFSCLCPCDLFFGTFGFLYLKLFSKLQHVSPMEVFQGFVIDGGVQLYGNIISCETGLFGPEKQNNLSAISAALKMVQDDKYSNRKAVIHRTHLNNFHFQSIQTHCTSLKLILSSVFIHILRFLKIKQRS